MKNFIKINMVKMKLNKMNKINQNKMKKIKMEKKNKKRKKKKVMMSIIKNNLNPKILLKNRVKVMTQKTLHKK